MDQLPDFDFHKSDELKNLSQEHSNQLAQGFGLGLNLNTSNGLFTFATAVGRADDISLDFTNIKVHIGYSSRF